MIDYPTSEKKENLPPDGTPSESRRKSTEKAKEQRLPVGGSRASSEHQENVLAARAILGDIVNCVISEPSPQPVEDSGDNEGDVTNRTLSPRSLSSHLLAAQSVHEEDCADRTFTLEANAEESLRASSEHQENVLVAQAILSDIVSCVVSEPSPQPVEDSGDNEGVVMNRTLSPRSLNSHFLAAQSVPEEDSAHRTFTFEASAEERPRPSLTLANGDSDASHGSMDTTAVMEPALPSETAPADTVLLPYTLVESAELPSETAPADTVLLPYTLAESAEVSACVPLTPERSRDDTDLVLLDTAVVSGKGTPLGTDQCHGTPDSASESRLLDLWYHTDASDNSLLGVGANKSELDLTYTTAKGSPLGAARYFDASSLLLTPTVAESEGTEVNYSAGSAFNESCDQGKTFCDILPKNTLELQDGHLEGSGNVTCVNAGDVSLLQDTGSAPGSTPKLLSPGLIEETLESPNKNFNLLALSDLQKASTPSTQEDLVPRFDNHCSVQSLADTCNESYKAAKAGSHFETPTQKHCQDETVTSTATDSNENLLTAKDAGNAEVSVIAKDPQTPAAGLSNEAAAHIQHHPHKGTTEGTLPVDSEAGPEVAQFSEEEHRAAAVYFKEDLDFLYKVSSSRRLVRTSLGRCSLFLKFDPLLDNSSPNAPREERRSKTRYSINPRRSDIGSSYVSKGDISKGDISKGDVSKGDVGKGDVGKGDVGKGDVGKGDVGKGDVGKGDVGKGDISNALIDLNFSEDLLNLDSPSSSQEDLIVIEEQMFSEKEMSQALKYQELMFQERLLKKDQESVRQLESVRQEAESFRGKLEESQKLCQIQERALQCLERHNENLVGALQLLGKDLQKEQAEKEESLQKIIRERDQLVEDLHNVEITFGDFHRRYEKAKHVISVMKENEATLKKQLEEASEALEKNCHMVHIIKTKTEESIEGANKEVENTKRNFEADITVLKGQLKKATMTINSLEKRLDQKNEENTELTKLYDDLLNQVKAK